MDEKKNRILVVDDNEYDRKLLNLRLNSQEFKVTMAESGQQALALLDFQEFDLILMDLMMPEMDGYELLQRVKKNKYMRHTPVIMITASDDFADAARCIDLGAEDFITKPFNSVILLARIHASIRKARAMLMNKERKHTDFTNNILIVDDDELDREFLKFQVQGQGYNVTTVANGLTALNMLGVKDFNLVLLDFIMPEVDGYQVLERIKSNDETSHIPVIMVTADKDIDDIARCIELGAADFITKPVNSSILFARIRASLREMHGDVKAEQQQIQSHVKASPDGSFLVKDGWFAQYDIIMAMAKLMEARNSAKTGHLERVREYCCILCKQLQSSSPYVADIDDRFIEHIWAAAPLHDIGQVMTPEYILFKEGKLSDTEMNIIKTHTTIGEETLHSINDHPDNDYLQMAIELAASHHERWNGKGYPGGLSKEDIPLSARILTVSDVYDGLTTMKRYRKNIHSHEQASKIIEHDSGVYFDPEIIKAFMLCKEEFQEVLKRHPGSISFVTSKIA